MCPSNLRLQRQVMVHTSPFPTSRETCCAGSPSWPPQKRCGLHHTPPMSDLVPVLRCFEHTRQSVHIRTHGQFTLCQHCLVDIRHLLSQVVLRVLLEEGRPRWNISRLRTDAVNLQKGAIGVAIGLAALVASAFLLSDASSPLGVPCADEEPKMMPLA